MLKRFCEVCRNEIQTKELYFDLTPERFGNAIIGVTDDEELYAEPYIHNHANLCSRCFKDIFLRGRYPIEPPSSKYYHNNESGRYPWGKE